MAIRRHEAILAGDMAAPVEPTQQVTVGQLFQLAQRVLALLKTAVSVHDADMSEAERVELTAVARETESTILDLMPRLDDIQRGNAPCCEHRHLAFGLIRHREQA